MPVFNLSKRFALIGFLSIALLSASAAFLLSRLLTEHMLKQEGVLTSEFINSLMMTENADQHLLSGKVESAALINAFNHIAAMPDVIRTTAHSVERMVIWSSDKAIVGQKNQDNDELDDALSGKLVVHSSTVDHEHIAVKLEHESLSRETGFFVEIYVPVFTQSGQVVGVIELYKHPLALHEAIRHGQQSIWVGALCGGALLYLALFWLVRHADLIIRRQQQQLVETETLAAIGEMSTAVAHGLRNPLASIRSSAELAAETDRKEERGIAVDIISEVDRLESWIRDLLRYSRPLASEVSRIDPLEILHRVSGEAVREAERCGIDLTTHFEPSLPPIKGDTLLLHQVLSSLMANAFEACNAGDSVALTARKGEGCIEIGIRDTGMGMSPEELARVFKPFYTTKPKGLGVGLAQARRIIEKFGGSISLSSTKGEGTLVTVRLQTIRG